MYQHHLATIVDVDGDDEQVSYHSASRSSLLVLVRKSVFMDKSVTFVDIIYLIYFINLDRIHEYN